ncbi:MAG TPA: hypothetical protein VIG46_07470 [Candidatus Baltobacteraceae bacterium]|jgi:uncharacterized membrane protein YphA (DoxX/SURF4 family)
MNGSLGRYAYGIAAIGLGVCALLWHDFSGWQQLAAWGAAPMRDALADIVAAIAILGGLAVLWPRTVRTGSLALGALALTISLLALPAIVRQPLVYNGYGNFFEQFSFVAGAALLYGRSAWARYAFGLCVISFALEQAFYLHETASLVPAWIPPGQTFWAVATTVAFALAGIALLAGRMARLAARLTAAMVAGFGILVWVPALFAHPRSFFGWSEAIETLGIAAVAWIVAESR